MAINEVAKLAGVSSSTVSRVINNHPRVAPQTALAVREAMRALSYVPSDRRPGPKPNRRHDVATRRVAFLAFGTSGQSATPGFVDLLRGVSQAANEHGIALSFSHVADPEDVSSQVMENTEGLLLHGKAPAAAVRERLRKTPTVWLMGNRRRPEWGDQVMPDGYEIGAQAARYLVERGHRRLAFLNLDAHFWPFGLYHHAFAATAQQTGAVVECLEEERRPPQNYWQPHPEEAVQRLADRFMALDDPPTGIFVADSIQVALLQPMLQERGVKIGRGVDLIACNKEDPYLVGLNPRPAVIDIHVEAIGRRGLEQLLWRIKNPKVAERLCTMVEPGIVP